MWFGDPDDGPFRAVNCGPESSCDEGMSLRPNEGVEAVCGTCNRIVIFPAGLLQRRYRLPSDTLIIDLQYRLRCTHCNARQGFQIAVVDVSEIKIAFCIPPDVPAPNFAPSWNVAPTDNLPIVRFDEKAGHRTLDLMWWGLVPYRAKDIKIGFSTINAMAETVATKPVFREAFNWRRCLVPVDNFCEWQKVDSKTKQPYAIALADGSIMALAGLWETWRSPAGETVRSFTIVTTTPNELYAPIHNRMPVILGADTRPRWLGEEPAAADELQALLAPYPAVAMTAWPVSARVGNVKNNDPGLIDEI